VSASAAEDLSLTAAQFASFRALIKEVTGINLGEGKGLMVERRLASRVRALALPGFAAYLEYLKAGHADEVEQFVNAVTTNLTSFFRENHHFDYLAQLLAQRQSAGPAASRRLRIWSAGCSTGEEPYSIAITLCEALDNLDGWDARILATDLDSSVLARAQTAEYTIGHLDRLPRADLRGWFQRGTGANAHKVRVKREAQALITFRQLNLLESWPMSGPFDAIFCRNVMIYFDKETQRRLVDRFAGMLVPGGHLFIGHSESLFNVSDRFRLLGRTIYQKAG